MFLLCVYLRPFAKSCSRAHATPETRVHATPRPDQGMVRAGNRADQRENPLDLQQQIACLELKDYFHAFESEENRSEMIGWVMSTFHLLHMIDSLTTQIERARISRLRAEGVATFRDMHPKVEELPVACQTLLRHSIEKVNKPAATIRQ